MYTLSRAVALIIIIATARDKVKIKSIIFYYILPIQCTDIVKVFVLCSWSGRPAGPTTNTARLSPRYEGKTRGCHSSH
jgi:hypothetical protein